MNAHAPVQKRQHGERAPQNAGPGKSSQAAGVGLPLFMQANPAASAGVTLQRQCASHGTSSANGACETCASDKFLQAKLTIGASDDPLEQEADRVADQVLAAPARAAVGGAPMRIQRFTGSPRGETGTAPDSVDRVLAGSGRSLEPALQQDMEQRFGHDFSRVRVHSDRAAEQSARDVNANAYTVGHEIVFGEGRFAPQTHQGQRLIAHELTHVVQQSGSDGFHVGECSDTPDRHAVSAPIEQRGKPSVLARAPSEAAKPDEEFVVVMGAKSSDPSDDRWFVFEDAGKQLKSLLPEGTRVLATGKPVIDVRGEQRIELRQVRIQSLPDKEGDPGVVGKQGMVRTRFLTALGSKPTPGGAQTPASPNPPSAAPVLGVPGVEAIEAWATTERSGESIEYAFAGDMAGMLGTVGAVSASARERLSKAFPASDSRIGLAVAVVRAATGEAGESSETLMDMVRVTSESDRTAIDAYLAADQSDHAAATATGLALDADAIQNDPLAVFKTRLLGKVVAKLHENLAVLDAEERKYANTSADSKEWVHLRQRVAPLIKRDIELQETLAAVMGVRNRLQEPIAAIAQQPVLQGATGASAASPEDAAIEVLASTDEQYLVPEEDANHVYDGGDGPAMHRIKRSLTVLDQRIFVMQTTHRGFRAEYPIAAGIEAGQLEGDASNEDIMAALRAGFFADFRSTIKATIADVQSGDIPLHKLTNFMQQTHDELGYDKNPAAHQAVEAWQTGESDKEAVIQAVIGGAVIALSLAALVATGGTAAIVLGVLGAAGGIADAVYNFEKAADMEQLAAAGDIANEMVEDRDEAKFNYWLAIFGLALSALDLNTLKSAGKTAVAALPKKAAVAEVAASSPRGSALQGDPAAAATSATLYKGSRRSQIQVGDAYSYATVTDGEVVAKLAKELEAKGKKVVIGTGGHGEYGTGQNLTNNPALAEDQFLLEDLDLGWDANIEILDLTSKFDYATFQVYEDAARLGGGNVATIRAWCFGAQCPLP